MPSDDAHPWRPYLDFVASVYREHPESPFAFRLAEPATIAELERVEAAIATSLDEALTSLWRLVGGSCRAPIVHDGELLVSYALLSPEEALEQRSAFAYRAPQYEGAFDAEEPRDARVGEGWFSPGWLPFAAADGGYAVLLVDHRPLGTGTPGQVIRYVHDPDRIDIVAESLGALMPVSRAAIANDPLEFLAIF